MAVNPNTFDIVGEDIYPEPPTHASQIDKFREVTSYNAGKMATLSECGSIPDPEEMLRDGAKWLWWLPWWGSFVYEPGERGRPLLNENGEPKPNPKYMDEEFIRRVFCDERVITLDDIPWRDKDKYRLPTPLLRHISEKNNNRQ
jgi:mannan endo-1,4-beta-mannosidase